MTGLLVVGAAKSLIVIYAVMFLDVRDSSINDIFIESPNTANPQSQSTVDPRNQITH